MLAAVVFGTFLFAACGGGDDARFLSNDLMGGPCDPGTVRECFGPKMCVGEQKCAPNGKGYTACACKGGPNQGVDAATDGPISNADAAGDGLTSNADAASDGPTSNGDAATDGTTSNGDASDDAPMPNLVDPMPGAADDAPR